jgi:SAUR family protein
MPKKVELEGRSRAPKGHFVVYVGNEMKRFVVPTSYLNSPIFQQLLDKAAEEFGFDNQNGIVLPCDESTFNRLTAFLAKHNS